MPDRAAARRVACGMAAVDEGTQMKTGKRLVGFLLTVAAMCAGMAFAEEVQKVGKADTREKFDLVTAAVRQEMAPGGRYEFVKGKDLAAVNQRLDEMTSLFGQYDSVDKMDQSAKLKMFNDQEFIDGILTKDDRNRLLCRRETQLGSNIPHTTCRRYGDIMADTGNTQDALRWMQVMQSQGLEITNSPAYGSHLMQSTLKGPGDASH